MTASWWLGGSPSLGHARRGRHPPAGWTSSPPAIRSSRPLTSGSPAADAMPDTYLGTSNGVHVLRDGGLDPLGAEGERISALHAWPAGGTTVVLAGSNGGGLHRSEDAGRTWSRVEAGLSAPVIRFLGPDPAHAGGILAGTEPGGIFRSEDGGLSWRELEGFATLPGR